MEAKAILLLFLFVVSGILYYQISEEAFYLEEHLVHRIIDGDTLETQSGEKVRLLGINTPEKGDLYSVNATSFLERAVLNKTIYLENRGYDKYGRILGYIFINEVNVNQELLENGLATLYYYEEDNYYNEMKNAEEKARKKEVNLWSKSDNFGCLELIEFKFKEEPKRCINDEKIILKNNCSYSIEFLLKDDATHIYEEKIEENGIFEKSFSCIWNDDGDSLYIYDSQGLVLFFRY